MHKRILPKLNMKMIGVIMALIVCYIFPMNWRQIWPERIARYKAWLAQRNQK